MNTFTKAAAQGDCFLVVVDAIPADAVPVAAESGDFIVAHSETGHHHIVKERPEVRMFQDAKDPLTAYLEILSIDVMLEHKRSFDTHASIKLPAGRIMVRRQREYTPEGFRRAQD